MKYVIIGDLHMKFQGHQMSFNNKPEHIHYPLINLEKAKNKAKELQGTLIIAGDLIDKQKEIHQVVLSELFESLKECSEEVETYIVMGNHDMVEYSGKYYTYLLCQHQIQVAVPGSPIDLGDALLVSYSDREKILEDMQSLDLSRHKLLVSHFGIEGAQVGYGLYQGGEFKPTDFGQLGITIILGHYHKPQRVSKNIYYVGSPYPVRVDEREDEKRFIVFDTETSEIDSIPTEYPKFKVLKISSADQLDIYSIKDDIQRNLTKYVIECPIDSDIRNLVDELTETYKNYIWVKEIEQEKKSETQYQMDIDSIVKSGISSILDEYLEKKGALKDKDLHIQILKEIGVEI